MGFRGRGGVFAALPETMRARRRSWGSSGAVLIPVLLAAACAAAPVAWEKPGATQQQWTRDRGDCRAKSRREAEKQMRRQGPDFRSSGFADDNTLSRDMAAFDARRNERRMFEQCMRLRGYTKKKAAPPKK